jgi:Flp pilus assembly CpaE family ATPase
VTGPIVERIVETAGRAFQFVVVDTGSEIDPRSEAVLNKATDIVIVVTPEFPALKAVHAMRELLDGGSERMAETTFILNQIFAREILRSRDIERPSARRSR